MREREREEICERREKKSTTRVKSNVMCVCVCVCVSVLEAKMLAVVGNVRFGDGDWLLCCAVEAQ